MMDEKSIKEFIETVERSWKYKGIKGQECIFIPIMEWDAVKSRYIKNGAQ